MSFSLHPPSPHLHLSPFENVCLIKMNLDSEGLYKFKKEGVVSPSSSSEVSESLNFKTWLMLKAAENMFYITACVCVCVSIYKPYESFPPTSFFFTHMLLCVHAYPKVQTCRCVFLRACGFLYAWVCILAACFHEVMWAYVYCYACMFLCVFLHSVCIPLWFLCVRASEWGSRPDEPAPAEGK